MEAHYPDYYPSAPGGSVVSRSIHALPVDLRKLGDDEKHLRRPGAAMAAPKGAWMTSNELEKLFALRRSWEGKWMLLRLIGRMVRTRTTGERIAAVGQALIARLRLALRTPTLRSGSSRPCSGSSPALTAESSAPKSITKALS